jgi:hypothetical protein
VFFFLSNAFLIVVPLVPPSAGSEPYESPILRKWSQWSRFLLDVDGPQSHVVIALFVGLLGVIYWFIVFKWIPGRNGYKLKQVTVIQDDGVPRNVFRQIPIAAD